MNPRDEQLLQYLKTNCTGRKKIQTRAQIQKKLNVSKDQLTDAVHRMRCQGIPIAGGPGGYYFARNAADLHSTICWLKGIVSTLLESINGLVKAMERFGLMEDAEQADGGGGGASG